MCSARNSRPLAAAGAALALLAGAAYAECAPPPQGAEGEAALRLRDDRAGRALAPVYVNGEGPFRFVVDTGANRSVLSADLAQRLGLAPHGQTEVHSVDQVRLAPVAHVRSLTAGAFSLTDFEAPVLSGDVFAEAQGFLGADGLASRRLMLDFKNRCVEILDARSAAPLPGWMAIQGRLQYGSSFVFDAYVYGNPVTVIVDTGSDISLGNVALREALRGDNARMIEQRGNFIYTAGRPIVLEEAVWTPRLWVGRMSIGNVTAYIGDYHVFRLWNLIDQPTLLIGMDVLAQAEAMAIDYDSATIHFRRRPRGRW